VGEAMNREIEFKGKRIDNGEWIYGDIYQPNTNNPLRHRYQEIYIHSHSNGSIVKVMPETVGEFFGLYDKTGKEWRKVYEGDKVIVRFKIYTDCSKSEIQEIKQVSGVITFWRSQWVVMEKLGSRTRIHSLEFFNLKDSDDEPDDDTIEIIGNVHESEVSQ
jgi:hypothetical protein